MVSIARFDDDFYLGVLCGKIDEVGGAGRSG